jgi:hypothetical protein
MERWAVSAWRAAFWASAGGAAWVVAGYPAALALLPARRARTAPVTPGVTVVVPTCVEHDRVAAKLATVAALDYPAGRLHAVVVADGDASLAAVARDALPGATVVALPQRSGKPAALNAALRHAHGDVVLLTDAHTPLAPGSLRAAVRHFADPGVWGVSGRWGERGSAYDAYEDALRRLETRSGSTACVFGAFFAVRRERLAPWPDGVVNDDLWLLCRLVREGGRVVYEPAARAAEAALDGHSAHERRARIGAGRVLLARDVATLPPGFAWRLASHKLGRLALPVCLLGTLISSLALSGARGWRALALAQLAFHSIGGLAAAGVRPPGPAGRLSGLAREVTAGNVAVAAGVVRALRGRQRVRWEAVR